MTQRMQFASAEEMLKHHGVKGMKWGVRKDRAAALAPAIQGEIKRTTANGDELTLKSIPADKMDKALALVSQNYANRFNSGARFTVTDKEGATIGRANFFMHKKHPDAIYLNWVTIESSARGRGYATEILKAAEQHSRASGKTRMMLEVPGNAPDARHIYEKMGFKPTGVTMGHKNDIWGGLTEMEKRFDDEERG